MHLLKQACKNNLLPVPLHFHMSDLISLLPHYLPPHILNKVMGLPVIFKPKVGEKLLPSERI